MTYVKGHPQYNTGKTWWKNGHSPWNKGLNLPLKPRTGKYIICKVCGREKYFQRNELRKRQRKYCSLGCYHLDSRKVNAGYQALHRWINSAKEKIKCEHCGAIKNLDMANISKEYRRELADWLVLCRKCHIAYDKPGNRQQQGSYA